MTSPVKRRSRAESQEDTRLALLDAGIELFVERGVDATSIEEVTSRAGFTRGAFYSNFDSKDELFVEVAKHFIDVLHAAARPSDGDDLDDAGRAYRDRLSRLRAVASDHASVFLAEISLYAIRHPEVRDEMVDLYRRNVDMAVPFARDVLRKAGIDKPTMPVDSIARLSQAITFAVHLFSLLDDDIDAEKLVGQAMALLTKGLSS